MADFFQDLHKPEYVHVLINHIPVTGLCVAVLMLLASAGLRCRPAMLLGMGFVALCAASAWAVWHFGHEAYDRVYSMAYSDGQAWLEYHEELADRWIYLYYVTAFVAAAGVVAGSFARKSLWVFVPLVIVLGLACLVAGAVISDAGGKVRHPEFRVGPAPKAEDADEASNLQPGHPGAPVRTPLVMAQSDPVAFKPARLLPKMLPLAGSRYAGSS